MDPEYALRYRDLYGRHWWWRARADRIVEELEALCPAGRRPAILDVGCGDGLFFETLARFGEVEGVEMDAANVDPAGRWAGRIHVQPFDATFRPDRRYGLVLLLDVLEHFGEPLPCLRRAIELLEDGGAALVTVPAFLAQWTTHDEINRHFTRYTRRTLAELARTAGARVDKASYFFHWTSPVKLAVRAKEAIVPTAPAPPRVPPTWVNDALYRVSRFEQKTLGRLDLPFGSSLIAVLRRAG